MSKMITALEIKKEYGVPTSFTRPAIKRYQIEHQVINGLISITLQDAEQIVYAYHAKQDSYTWKDVAEKFNVSTGNKCFRKLIDSILPHYCLDSKTYYPIKDIEDVLADTVHYHIKKYKDKYYYLEGSREDLYINNYFTISEFRQVFKKRYGMRLKLHSLSEIERQLGKTYPVETINLFGFWEYMIPRKYMQQLMEDYYIFYTIKGEKEPYSRYETEVKYLDAGQMEIKKTWGLFDEFAKLQISKTKNQLKIAKVMASLKKYLANTLYKEIYLYENNEICNLFKSAKISQIENAEMCLFLKYVLSKYKDKCTFDVVLSPQRELKVKTEQDFYTEEEWLGYINFIFNIDLHIEKAFSCSRYARYWLYCMLQCSLAWRVEDILDMPSLQMKDIMQYSVEWFEQNEFTSAMAWAIINTAKKFIEQNKVNKTGAKKHFIILNSFVIATSIGFIICEKHRQETGAIGLFDEFYLHYGTMVRKLGPEIEGFSNLKATRTILSFANETASRMDYSGQAISIASYMRSHIRGKSGFSDTTSIYLKSSFDEKELLSFPAKIGELGLFGWLYHEILTAIDEEPKIDKEILIGIIREEITPVRLEGYSGYMLQEKKKRADIVAEIMRCNTENLKELREELENGRGQGKKEYIYCVKASCQYQTSQNCELCRYAIPSIHALCIIGQEALGLLDKLINRQGTAMDRERYSYQLFKLLTILKEAKEEFGDEVVSSFTDYEGISEKLDELQNIKKGVE